ncbi:MAG TPA: acetyl-CoA hydrolase/transferase C-terminal domain-containing protein [Steroidobacteraceae bacterium]|nr:acetyl-CoA hydrolase/transferase C-terminal domain-containing protein [Steroidobacteraceae bacterium]
MNAATPRLFDDVGECVEATLRRLGNRLVIAAPLAIGKPNSLLNEFFRRAARDPRLRLTLVTALSLNRPTAHNALEARFLGPFVSRVFGDYVDLDYLKAARAGRMPPNVEVREFYLQPGAWLGVESVQQHYISVNYSHVARDLLDLGVNVIAQQVASRSHGGRTDLSLGSNSDVTLDLLPHVDAAQAAGRDVVLIAAVNRQMPFMLGDAVVPPERFDFLLDHPRYEHDLYGPPSQPIGAAEHAIGVNAAALVHDGGTLQLGIGAMADAIVYALQLRQQRNEVFRSAVAATGAAARFATEIAALGGVAPLERGLYACSELFVDGFLDLYRTGILSRRVYPQATLQRLLDAGEVSERIDIEMLVALARAGLSSLDAPEFAALERCGLFLPGTRFAPPTGILAADGQRIEARLDDPATRARIAEHCLARRLSGGHVLHSGFLLGPRGFYAALRELAEDDRERFSMTRISYTNTLYGSDYALRVAQRRHARFINSTMIVTGLGAAVSDTLDSGQVVSGVGGQYNFVAMAHELPEARSILLVRSTRSHSGRVSSNIVWNYGHVTIPRHLRDVVVSEYGIADLRGRCDRDCVAALLAITDSRFQTTLLAEAKRAGKIEKGYSIPDAARANTPAALAKALRPLRAQGLFSEFPFGTDYTAEEVVLVKALRRLEALTATRAGRVRAAVNALSAPVDAPYLASYLERLKLDAPLGWRERLTARLVAATVRDVLATKD